ncbi:glycosyltransferase [Amphritea sp. HPY]|uniref:glycosyltransferase n=1 Tax=Amphritea sp. HPY TaxID=3421652 RepID=UPI003D7F0A67
MLSVKSEFQALWIGEKLSILEHLSLKSFVVNGHNVTLYTYGPVDNVPDGVVLADAGEILPESEIFVYKNRKSYAAFANWFRYKLLLERGGYWIDTDVVCLRPFDFERPVVFGYEENQRVNNAVIGFPAGHSLMKHMEAVCRNPNQLLPYDNRKTVWRKRRRKYLKGNQRGDLVWGETGPGGLSNALKYHGMMDQAMPFIAFYPVTCSCWQSIFDDTFADSADLFSGTYAVHLWNEMLRRDGLGKDDTFSFNSLIEQLKRRYDVV